MRIFFFCILLVMIILGYIMSIDIVNIVDMTHTSDETTVFMHTICQNIYMTEKQ